LVSSAVIGTASNLGRDTTLSVECCWPAKDEIGAVQLLCLDETVGCTNHDLHPLRVPSVSVG